MQTSLSTWTEASRIHTEVFGPLVSFAPGVVDSTNGIPHFPTGIQGSGPIVSFARSSVAVHWDNRFKPHGGLSHLRVWLDRWPVSPFPRAAGSALRGQCPDLLFDTDFKCGT
jgi:hypothetical protein